VLPMISRAAPGVKSNFDSLLRKLGPMIRMAARVGRRAGWSSLNVSYVFRQGRRSYCVAGKVALANGVICMLVLLLDGPMWDAVESIEAAGEEEVF